MVRRCVSTCGIDTINPERYTQVLEQIPDIFFLVKALHLSVRQRQTALCIYYNSFKAVILLYFYTREEWQSIARPEVSKHDPVPTFWEFFFLFLRWFISEIDHFLCFLCFIVNWIYFLKTVYKWLYFLKMYLFTFLFTLYPALKFGIGVVFEIAWHRDIYLLQLYFVFLHSYLPHGCFRYSKLLSRWGEGHNWKMCHTLIQYSHFEI